MSDREPLDSPATIDTLPLMGEVPFYSVFMLSSTKERRYKELERALTLFIKVLEKHEKDQVLRMRIVADAQRLLTNVRSTKSASFFTTNLKARNAASLQKNYQDTVKDYGESTSSQFNEFHGRFKSLWNGPRENDVDPGIVVTQTTEDTVPASSKPSGTIRRMMSKALFATLSKDVNKPSLQSNITNNMGVSSYASSEVSGEGTGQVSDTEADFVTFETSLWANRIRVNNSDDPQQNEQTNSPSIIEEDIHPPRGSAEWPKRHRVQLSTQGGQFRLVHGRSGMAERRDSYIEGEYISPVHSVIERPESSLAAVDTHSSTSSPNPQELNYLNYYHHHPEARSSGNLSEITGNVSFFSSEE